MKPNHARENAGMVVTGDLVEQAPGVCDHAYGVGYGLGLGESPGRFCGPDWVVSGHGEPAQCERAGLQRANVTAC